MDIEPTKILYDQDKNLHYKLIRDYENYRIYENGEVTNSKGNKMTIKNHKLNLCKNGKYKNLVVTRLMYENWYNKKLTKQENIKFCDNDKTNLHYTNIINPSEPNSNHLELDICKEWKFVKGYPFYKTSNYGDIFSIKVNRILIPQLDCKGYFCIKLTNDSCDNLSIHYIVYTTFIGDIGKDKVIDHKNRIRTDNFVDNLQEATYSENNKNSTRGNPKGHLVHQYSLDNVLIKEWDSLKEASKTLKINKHKIKECSEGLTNEYQGFIWKFPGKILDTSDFHPIVANNGETYSNYKIRKNSDIITSKNFLLKYSTDSEYKRITLQSDNKKLSTFGVHILVAMTFISNDIKENDIVNHIDENKMNAHVDNLEWCTSKHNSTHSLGIKVNQIDIKTGKILNTFNSMQTAADSIGIKNSAHIGSCCKGTQKTANGFKWTYA